MKKSLLVTGTLVHIMETNVKGFFAPSRFCTKSLDLLLLIVLSVFLLKTQIKQIMKQRVYKVRPVSPKHCGSSLLKHCK